MTKLKLALRRFFFKIRHEYLVADNVVLFLTVGACLLFTGYSITAMSRNWELAQRLASAEKTKTLLELETETIALENIYHSSPEYQELAARHFHNKKLPGEQMVYLSNNSEYAKTKHQKSATDTDSVPSPFAQWMQFLFGN